MEKVYVPTIRSLSKAGKAAESTLSLFEMLAGLWNISEEGLRKRWLEDGECCNPSCESRGEPDLKMKRCKRCQKVLYCSAKCQKAYVAN